jgi:hypothetical protein
VGTGSTETGCRRRTITWAVHVATSSGRWEHPSTHSRFRPSNRAVVGVAGGQAGIRHGRRRCSSMTQCQSSGAGVFHRGVVNSTGWTANHANIRRCGYSISPDMRRLVAQVAGADRSRDLYSLMFAARSILPHLSVNSTTNVPKADGEPTNASSPSWATRCLKLASARAALITLLSLPTISAGPLPTANWCLSLFRNALPRADQPVPGTSAASSVACAIGFVGVVLICGGGVAALTIAAICRRRGIVRGAIPNHRGPECKPLHRASSAEKSTPRMLSRSDRWVLVFCRMRLTAIT